MLREKGRTWLSFGCLAIIAVAVADPGNRSSARAALPTQDVMTLDRRISTLEQRLFMMESTIGQLRQEIQYVARQPATAAPTVSAPPSRDIESERLRLEYELLRSRLTEIECGLVRLDERTLPPETRAGKSKSPDPCRALPNTPIMLSTHPR